MNLTASIRPANFRNTEGLELNVHVDTVTDIFLAAWQVASTRIWLGTSEQQVQVAHLTIIGSEYVTSPSSQQIILVPVKLN
jgi:hypothetical protein